MTNTRLRLTPSEFGALWTYILKEPITEAFPMMRKMSFVAPFNDEWKGPMTPDSFIDNNDIELIEEYNPDFRPRWENVKLTVDPLFRTWADCLNEPGGMALLRAIQ